MSAISSGVNDLKLFKTILVLFYLILILMFDGFIGRSQWTNLLQYSLCQCKRLCLSCTTRKWSQEWFYYTDQLSNVAFFCDFLRKNVIIDTTWNMVHSDGTAIRSLNLCPSNSARQPETVKSCSVHKFALRKKVF